jgi:hypothetical protein
MKTVSAISVCLSLAMIAHPSVAQGPATTAQPNADPPPGSGQLSARAQADLERRIANYQSKPFHLAVEDQGDRWLLMEFNRQAPALKAQMWYAGAVVPPGVGGTDLLYMGIQIAAASPNWTISTDPHNPIRKTVWSRFPAGIGSQSTLQAKILYHVHLTRSHLAPGARASPVPPLSFAERSAELSNTRIFDYKSFEFQQWLKQNNLIKSEGETTLAFAARVGGFMRRSRSYKVPYKYVPLSSLTTMSTGECGMLATTYAGIMRANNIPARILSGDWLPGFAHHSRLQFYADDIGWVPVDGSGLSAWSEDNWLIAIGTQNALFYTDQLDFEYQFDGRADQWGTSSMVVHPRQFSGSDHDAVVKVTWKLLEANEARAFKDKEFHTVVLNEVANEVTRQVNLAMANGPPSPPTENKPSPTERLKELKEVFEKGLISQEVYDQKRKEILDSL